MPQSFELFGLQVSFAVGVIGFGFAAVLLFGRAGFKVWLFIVSAAYLAAVLSGFLR